jgi:hypothetical protein
VLGTLVTSARAVFRVLAEHQLDDPGAGGASQALLFRMCRERFILNSEQVRRPPRGRGRAIKQALPEGSSSLRAPARPEPPVPAPAPACIPSCPQTRPSPWSSPLPPNQALRSHLVEFRDHELVRGRPAPDGTELLYIPLERDALEAVLAEMEAAPR